MAGLARAGVQLVVEGYGPFLSQLQNAQSAIKRFGAGGVEVPLPDVSKYGSVGDSAGGFFSKAFSQVVIGGLREAGAAGFRALANVGSYAFDTISSSITESVGQAASLEQQVASIASSPFGDPSKAKEYADIIQSVALDPKLVVGFEQAGAAALSLTRNSVGFDQLNDSLRSTVLLQNQVGQTGTAPEFATTAQVVARAGQIFGLSGQNIIQTANQIPVVIGAGFKSIQDYSYALSNAGQTAAAQGISFGQFNKFLAYTADSFSSGRTDATAFSSFIQHLSPDTKKATEAMKELGLNFYDANGSFIGADKALTQLQQTFNGTITQSSLVGGRNAEQQKEYERLGKTVQSYQQQIRDLQTGVTGANLTDKQRGARLDALNKQLAAAQTEYGKLDAITGQYVETSRKLSQKDRQDYLQAIFGSEGGRFVQALLSVTDAEKKRVDSLLDTADASKAAEIRTDTLSAKFNNLTDQALALGASFGSPLLAPLKDFVSAASEIIPALNPLASSLGQGIADFIQPLASDTSAFASNFAKDLRNLAQGGLTLGETFGAVGTAIGQTFTQTSATAQKFTGYFQQLKQAFGYGEAQTTGLDRTGQGAAGLTSSSDLSAKTGFAKDTLFGALGGGPVDFFAKPLLDVKSLVDAAQSADFSSLSSIGTFLSSVGSTLSSSDFSSLQSVGSFLSSVGTSLASGTFSSLESIGTFVAGLGTSLASATFTSLESVTSFVAGIGTSLASGSFNSLGNITTFVSGLGTSLASANFSSLNSLSTFVSGLGTSLASTSFQPLATISSGLGSLSGALSGFVASADSTKSSENALLGVSAGLTGLSLIAPAAPIVALSALAGGLSGLQQALNNTDPSKLSAGTAAVRDSLNALGSLVAAPVDALGQATGAQSVAQQISTQFSSISAAFSTFQASPVQGIADGINAIATTISGADAALQGATGEGSAFQLASETVAGLFTSISQAISAVPTDQAQAVGGALSSVVTSTFGALSSLASIGGESLTPAVGAISGTIQSVLGLITDVTSGLQSDQIGAAASGFAGNLITQISSTLTATDIPGLADAAGGFVSAATNQLALGFAGAQEDGSLATSVGTFATAASTALSTALASPDLGTSIGQSAGNLSSSVVSAVGIAIDTASSFISGFDTGSIVSGFAAFMGNVASGFAGVVSGAQFQGVVNNFSNSLSRALGLDTQSVSAQKDKLAQQQTQLSSVNAAIKALDTQIASQGGIAQPQQAGERAALVSAQTNLVDSIANDKLSLALKEGTFGPGGIDTSKTGQAGAQVLSEADRLKTAAATIDNLSNQTTSASKLAALQADRAAITARQTEIAAGALYKLPNPAQQAAEQQKALAPLVDLGGATGQVAGQFSQALGQVSTLREQQIAQPEQAAEIQSQINDIVSAASAFSGTVGALDNLTQDQLSQRPDVQTLRSFQAFASEFTAQKPPVPVPATPTPLVGAAGQPLVFAPSSQFGPSLPVATAPSQPATAAQQSGFPTGFGANAPVTTGSSPFTFGQQPSTQQQAGFTTGFGSAPVTIQAQNATVSSSTSPVVPAATGRTTAEAAAAAAAETASKVSAQQASSQQQQQVSQAASTTAQPASQQSNAPITLTGSVSIPSVNITGAAAAGGGGGTVASVGGVGGIGGTGGAGGKGGTGGPGGTGGQGGVGGAGGTGKPGPAGDKGDTGEAGATGAQGKPGTSGGAGATSGTGGGGGSKGGGAKASAAGTKSYPGGRGIGGELGPELYVTKDKRVGLIGENGIQPFVLPSGSVIYPHDVTEKLLHGAVKPTTGLGEMLAGAFATGTNPSFPLPTLTVPGGGISLKPEKKQKITDKSTSVKVDPFAYSGNQTKKDDKVFYSQYVKAASSSRMVSPANTRAERAGTTYIDQRTITENKNYNLATTSLRSTENVGADFSILSTLAG
jgi:TP901 family phage tail tape measure protein